MVPDRERLSAKLAGKDTKEDPTRSRPDFCDFSRSADHLRAVDRAHVSSAPRARAPTVDDGASERQDGEAKAEQRQGAVSCSGPSGCGRLR